MRLSFLKLSLLASVLLISTGMQGRNESNVHRELGQRSIDEQLERQIETRRAVFISDYGYVQGGISFWRAKQGQPMLTIAFPWNKKDFLIPERLSRTLAVSDAVWQKVLAVTLPPKPVKRSNKKSFDENGEPEIAICLHGRTGLVDAVAQDKRGWRKSSVIANACDDDRPLDYWSAIAEIAADAVPNCRLFVEEVFRTSGFDNCILASGLDAVRANILKSYRDEKWSESFGEKSLLKLATGQTVGGPLDVKEAFALSDAEEMNPPGIYKLEAADSGRLLAHFVIRREKEVDEDKTISHHAYGTMILRGQNDPEQPVVIDHMNIGPFQPSKK